MVLRMQLLKIILVLFACFHLSACGTVEATKKVAQVLLDPKIQVGSNKDQPTVVSISLVAEDNANKNEDGDPVPIQIQIFQLKDDSKFLSADYDSIFQDVEAVLGKNYISHEEFAISPSRQRYLDSMELDPNTKYIGVVAHYRDIDNVIWKKVMRVKPLAEQLQLLVLLKEHEVKFDRMED